MDNRKTLEKMLRLLLVTSALTISSCGHKKPEYISILQDKSAKIEHEQLSLNCKYLDREDMEDKLDKEQASMGWGGMLFYRRGHIDKNVSGFIEYKDKNGESAYLKITKIDPTVEITPIMKKDNKVGEIFLMADIKEEEDSYNYAVYAFCDKEFFKNNQNLEFESAGVWRDGSVSLPNKEKAVFQEVYNEVYAAQIKGSFPHRGSLHLSLGTEDHPLVAINPPK